MNSLRRESRTKVENRNLNINIVCHACNKDFDRGNTQMIKDTAPDKRGKYYKYVMKIRNERIKHRSLCL